MTAYLKSVTRFGYLLAPAFFITALSAEPLSVSGVYPSLTMRNNEGECGTGAVVPWQGSLWAVTYAPHMPKGSSDKLYEISPDLKQRIFAGSVGGTPANRMIHRESNQLIIASYLIDSKKAIRVIPQSKMLGRLTGNARHLVDPENKVYYATMEEGLYSVDLNTLKVTCHIRDGHAGTGPGLASELPGYHGKGLYSSQGRLVYSNNGTRDRLSRTDPTIPSGALAQWFGEGDWQLVRRNQFTEVTGPGGIHGNENPATDRVWAMGWDARSLILALLEDREWYYYRLPKGSHSYDGSHGWNTEWPRIREIGEKDFLATMHGTFWRFPGGFSRKNSAGIAPRSNYLKVIGDFCRWNDRIVLGCDDSAKSEFINTRSFKAKHGAPGQSNSNLWFIKPDRLDHIGPVIGRGSIWLRDDVKAGEPSDPYLFSGYDYRQLHLVHQNSSPVSFVLEVDRDGTSQWEVLKEIKVGPNEAVSHLFNDETGVWIRLTAKTDASHVSAHFQYRNRDRRHSENDPIFAGISTPGKPAGTTGVMRSLRYDRLGLTAASDVEGEDFRYYEINHELELVRVDKKIQGIKLADAVRQPQNTYTEDEASVLLIEDGKRYRLPKNPLYEVTEKGIPGSGRTLTDYLEQSLTRGSSISVNSTHDTYQAKFAVDGVIGDDSERWISANTGNAVVELDLGAEKEIRSIWIVSGWKGDPAYVATDFDVQIGANGEWKTIPGGEVRGNTLIEREIRLPSAIDTRKLRIVSRQSGFFRIYEIAAFSEVPDLPRTFAGFGPARVCREVATERDLLNVHGTFYELPARNAQGLAKVRPVATHNLAIQDFCSHNGLLFITGIDTETENPHIFRSADGKAAVWAGVVDDLWKLGKPRGMGGPWKDTKASAGVPSDPYLMTAYDQKILQLEADRKTKITAEIDIDGTGLWIPWKSWSMEPETEITEAFPEGFSAYWIRFSSSNEATVTAQLQYD